MKKKGKKVLAILMAALMVVGIMPMDWAAVKVDAAAGKHELDGTDIAVENSNGYKGDSIDLDKDGYFKLVTPGGATKVDDNKKTFDEVEYTRRIKLYKSNSNPGKIMFTTEGAATVKVCAMSGGSGVDIEYGIYDAEGKVIGKTATAYGTAPTEGLKSDTFTVESAGTYYICSYASTKGLNIHHVTVEEKSSVPATGTAPVISSASAALTEEGTIDVTWETSTEGSGDGETVVQVSKDGGKYEGVSSVKFDAEKKVTYRPTESGKYTFKVNGKVGDTETEAKTTAEVEYVLPLAAPEASVKRGDSQVTVSWDEVKEATSYDVVWYDSTDKELGKETITVAEGVKLEKTVTGLTNCVKYGFKVIANRATPAAEAVGDVLYVRPYKSVDMANAIPGLTPSNQDKEEAELIVIRENGDITVSQPATSGGVSSSSTKNASFLSMPATTNDFNLSAYITITSMDNANDGRGIALGAYSDLTSTDKTMVFSHLIFATSGKIRHYRTKAEDGGRGGADFTNKVEVNKTYKGEVIRSGDTITVSIYDETGKLIDSKAQDVKELTKLKAGASVTPAIYICGVNATLKNIKYTEGSGDNATVKFDSTKLTGSFTSYADNWEVADTPIITSAVQKEGKIVVTVDGEIGVTGASKIDVVMKDSDGKTVDTQTASSKGMTREVEFEPTASGNYTFEATASRTGEESVKKSGIYAYNGYILPIAAPELRTRTGANSNIVVSWNAVNEATSYKVEYKLKGAAEYTTLTETTGLTAETPALTVGSTYVFKVTAMRKSDGASTSSKEVEYKVAENEELDWLTTRYGSSTNKDNNGSEGSIYSNDLRVYSKNGKGKLVPNSSDGLTFYYTALDSKLNFTLTAKIKVNDWTYSNGQEGFGLMATDAVGKDGDSSTFMNNSYMTMVSKVEYYYNQETQSVSDAGDKITMKLGVGALERIGNTLDDNENVTLNDNFTTTTRTLDTSCAKLGAGTYNIVGNATKEVTGTQENAQTEFTLTLKKDNTGYRCIYTDAAGNVTKETFYDFDNENLTKIDPEHIYVGFFAARNADISVTDASLTYLKPEDDAPAETPETTYVTPVQSVTSPSATGNANYNLTFTSNSDGVVTIKDPNGNVIVDKQAVTANAYLTAPQTILESGNNKFEITYKPNDDYKPGKFKELSSYDEVTFEYTVNHKTYGKSGQSIWVSPDGSSKASGSKNDPMDIYTAVKYVQPGQTIVLMGGTYNLESTVKVARGIDGTIDQLITMVADPDAESRPVFDFGGKCAGMVLAGNYWYFQGFDVTNSQDGQKGIQVSGNNNVLDQVNTYKNGNTGIQISRLLGTDLFENWPANNTILNCTSHNNSDSGYEDADGFAAKLTVAEGNEFIGCIASNNADDGWDLFAKIETGSIGKVTIKNCLAYNNGFLEDGTDAGNGNGFKLGGDSLSGKHELNNSIAFGNKAKGIDSNSCPDIQVYNCTAFNNGCGSEKTQVNSNVAFYTNTAKNTDFIGNGIISFKYGMSDKAMAVGETFKPVGSQDTSKYLNNTNYYWYGVSSAEAAIKTFDNGTEVAADETVTTAQLDWFESIDIANANSIITRKANGSINMNGLLVLTDKAPANAGARIYDTPSKVIGIPESVPTGDTTNSIPFAVMVVLSAAMVAGVYFFDKKRKTVVRR